MARGNDNNNGVKTVFYVNPFLKKDQEPWLRIIGKVGNQYKQIDQNKWISGFITDIRACELKFDEENVVPGLSITLTDFRSDEAYIFRISREGNSGRDIILRLANVDDLNVTLGLKVYQNDQGYSAISVRINDKKVERLHNHEWEKNLTTEVMDGNKKIILRGELNKAIDEIFAELVARFNANKITRDNTNPSDEEDIFDTAPASQHIAAKDYGTMNFDNPPAPEVMPNMNIPEEDDLPF